MSLELAERVYRKHGRSIFGAVLTKHFFIRFFERSNDLEKLGKVLRKINKTLPEMVFDLTLSGNTKVFVIEGYKVPCILQMNEGIMCPEIIVKTLYK